MATVGRLAELLNELRRELFRPGKGPTLTWTEVKGTELQAAFRAGPQAAGAKLDALGAIVRPQGSFFDDKTCATFGSYLYHSRGKTQANVGKRRQIGLRPAPGLNR